MILTIIIVLISLVILLILHELGHFLTAKKLGIGVEEFGIGYPPRLFGKKIGNTLYSINLLPFGAFVKILGEEKKVKDSRSFSERPIWQRSLVVLGGVVSFWLTAFIIFSLIAGIWGLPYAVSDNYSGKAFVQIVQVAKGSPAERAGIKAGDIIVGLNKVKDVQNFVDLYKGHEVIMTVKRGDKDLDFKLTPRLFPPKGQGSLGVALTRVSKIKSPWYKCWLVGAKVTIDKTIQIPLVLGKALGKLFVGEKTEEIQMVGPIGVGKMMTQALDVGIDNFLMFIAMIAVWLALFNSLPIPALDGGKFLFLIIEAIRKKPMDRQTEEKLNGIFFLLLIALMVVITVKDIVGLF